MPNRNRRLVLWILYCFLFTTMAGAVFAQESPYVPVEVLAVEVISERPHDSSAFTQGLLFHDGLFYESTGRRGQSTVREVDPVTGEVLRSLAVPEQIFAEGLALVDDELYQLSWQSQAALVYSLEPGAETDFEPLRYYQYTGEGWGLCYDGAELYMSDGSNTIFVRNPETFQIVRQFRVRMNTLPVDMINELECVGDSIWANVWQTDTIIRIDKITGEITAIVDTAGLFPDGEHPTRTDGNAVLNGIAYDEANDVFFITGKLWPSIFEVRFVPAEED